MHETQEDGQKPHFLALFCTIYAHYAYLFNCAWPITTARFREIFRTAIICDTESLRATEVKKMAKKLIFALFKRFKHIMHT